MKALITLIGYLTRGKFYDNFDVIVFIKKHIFTLEIAVSESTSMDIVNSLDKLFCIVTANFFAKWARVRNIVK